MLTASNPINSIEFIDNRSKDFGCFIVLWWWRRKNGENRKNVTRTVQKLILVSWPLSVGFNFGASHRDPHAGWPQGGWPASHCGTVSMPS